MLEYIFPAYKNDSYKLRIINKAPLLLRKCLLALAYAQSIQNRLRDVRKPTNTETTGNLVAVHNLETIIMSADSTQDISGNQELSAQDCDVNSYSFDRKKYMSKY